MAAAKIKPKQVAMYLIIAFLVVSVWKSPTVSADYATDFLTLVGRFIVELYRKLSQFIEGVGNGTSAT